VQHFVAKMSFVLVFLAIFLGYHPEIEISALGRL